MIRIHSIKHKRRDPIGRSNDGCATHKNSIIKSRLFRSFSVQLNFIHSTNEIFKRNSIVQVNVCRSQQSPRAFPRNKKITHSTKKRKRLHKERMENKTQLNKDKLDVYLNNACIRHFEN